MDLSTLPGLGPKRVQVLNEAGFHSVTDLLYNVPRTWVDRTRISRIADSKEGDLGVFVGKIARAGVIRGRKSRFIAYLDDEAFYAAPKAVGQTVHASWEASANHLLRGTNNSTGNPFED